MSEEISDLLESIRTSSSHDDVYYAAIKLRELGNGNAIDPLLDRLERNQDPSWLRELLIEALYCSFPQGGYSTLKATDLLLKIFTSELEHQDVRAVAGLALGYVGDNQVVETLIRTLESGNIDLSYACVTALGNIGDPKAVDVLIKIIKTQKFPLTQAAAEALGKIGPLATKAIPILQSLERKGNETEKRYVLEAITKIREQQ